MNLDFLADTVRKLLFGKNIEDTPTFFVLLSCIPVDSSERTFSLVEFSRIDLVPRYRNMTRETFNTEARLFLAIFDIEEIFETKEEARLYLESISVETVPASDLRVMWDGNGVSSTSRKKGLEWCLYKEIRPREPILRLSGI